MFQSMSPEQQAQVQSQASTFMGGQGAAASPAQGAQALKNEGNRLHSAGQYAAACEKYETAIRGAQGASLAALAGLGPWSWSSVLVLSRQA